MLYVSLNSDRRAVSASTEYPGVEAFVAKKVENRNDWKTMERAEEVAAQLTEATGVTYLATDSGPNVSPRFDVVAAPVIGSDVSEYFNGDAYPHGTIIKVSASFRRVETSDGTVFTRRRKTGAWLHGGFSMIEGHHNDRNPSF